MEKVFAIADSMHDFTKGTRRGQDDIVKKYAKNILTEELKNVDPSYVQLLERTDVEHAMRARLYGAGKTEYRVEEIMNQTVPITSIFNMAGTGAGGYSDVVVPRDKSELIMTLLDSMLPTGVYITDITLLTKDIICSTGRPTLMETIATEYDRNRISVPDACTLVQKESIQNALGPENFLALTRVDFDTETIRWINTAGQTGVITIKKLISKQDFANLPLFSKSISKTVIEGVVVNEFAKIILNKYGLAASQNKEAYVKTLFDFKRLGDLGQMAMASLYKTVFVSNDLMACLMSSVLFKNPTLHTSKKPPLDIYGGPGTATSEVESTEEDDLRSSRGYTFYNLFGTSSLEAFNRQVAERQEKYFVSRLNEYLALFAFYYELATPNIQQKLKSGEKMIALWNEITRRISTIRASHSGAGIKRMLKATEYEFIPNIKAGKTRGAAGLPVPEEYYFVTELIQLELCRLMIEYIQNIYAIFENVKDLPNREQLVSALNGLSYAEQIKTLENTCDAYGVPKLRMFVQPVVNISKNIEYLDSVLNNIEQFLAAPKIPGEFKAFKFGRLVPLKEHMQVYVQELVRIYNLTAGIHKFKRGGGTVAVGEYILYCAVLTPEENNIDTLLDTVNQFQRFIRANTYVTQKTTKRRRMEGGGETAVPEGTVITKISPASAPTRLTYTPTYRTKTYPKNYTFDLADVAFKHLKNYPVLLFQYLFLKDFTLEVIGVGRVKGEAGKSRTIKALSV